MTQWIVLVDDPSAWRPHLVRCMASSCKAAAGIATDAANEADSPFIGAIPADNPAGRMVEKSSTPYALPFPANADGELDHASPEWPKGHSSALVAFLLSVNLLDVRSVAV